MSYLFLTLSFVVGLYFLHGNIVLSIIVSAAYLTFLFIRFSKKQFFVYLLIFMVGAVVPRVSFSNKEQPLRGFVIEARDNYIIYESKLNKYYVLCEDNDFEMGDYLVVNGEVSKLKLTTYESRFNFENYLLNKGVNNELKIISIDSRINALFKVHAFKKRFLSKFDENTASLISAFLFNDKDYSTYPIKLADRSDILYLFSLSGMYLQILFVGLNYLLFFRYKKRTSTILTFLILLPFALFSFTKIGTLRVYSLFFLKYLNEFHFKKRKFTHLELVSILALFFLIIDYNLVYQEAFYIGFSLSALSPFIHNAVKVFDKKKRKLAYAALIRLFIIPIRISSGNFDFLYMCKYLLIFPLNFLFLLSSMLSVLFRTQKMTRSLGMAMVWMLEKMDLVKSSVPVGTWGGVLEIVFILVFFFTIYFLETVMIKRLKILILSSVSLLLISITPFQEPISNAVYFVNVGQGDSIIIKNRTHTVMIDTGGNKSFDIAMECLIPFMNKNKITHIDALITTHDDFDHAGAKDSLINNFKVNNYLNDKEQFPYTIGDITLNNVNINDYDEENNNSLVLYMEFMNKKWLFMGDASTKVEKDIIDNYSELDCDIIKIGHHGSKTSTCEELLKTVTPSEAVVSVSAKNYYGHPSDEVIERLMRMNIKIRRTDEEGTISYYSLKA